MKGARRCAAKQMRAHCLDRFGTAARTWHCAAGQRMKRADWPPPFAMTDHCRRRLIDGNHTQASYIGPGESRALLSAGLIDLSAALRSRRALAHPPAISPRARQEWRPQISRWGQSSGPARARARLAARRPPADGILCVCVCMFVACGRLAGRASLGCSPGAAEEPSATGGGARDPCEHLVVVCERCVIAKLAGRFSSHIVFRLANSSGSRGELGNWKVGERLGSGALPSGGLEKEVARAAVVVRKSFCNSLISGAPLPTFEHLQI